MGFDLIVISLVVFCHLKREIGDKFWKGPAISNGYHPPQGSNGPRQGLIDKKFMHFKSNYQGE